MRVNPGKGGDCAIRFILGSAYSSCTVGKRVPIINGFLGNLAILGPQWVVAVIERDNGNYIRVQAYSYDATITGQVGGST